MKIISQKVHYLAQTAVVIQMLNPVMHTASDIMNFETIIALKKKLNRKKEEKEKEITAFKNDQAKEMETFEEELDNDIKVLEEEIRSLEQKK